MDIKLDIANAFHRIRHCYIFQVMKNYGFHDAFIRWVKACIINPWIAPLINGLPTPFLQDQRGIRKGCMMSPFLYILVAYSLSGKFNRLINEGRLPGISIARGVQINHAYFADDTIILGSASTQIARRFKATLDLFLKILVVKSMSISPGCMDGTTILTPFEK